MNILVLHGPNLNLLGEREPEIYGAMTLGELNARLQAKAAALGVALRIHQSNHEGVLIDTIHAERRWMSALIINPGALTHYSYALRDAIAAIKAPAFEVHLSDITKREAFRRVSVVSEVCAGSFMGKGLTSYIEALHRAAAPAQA